MAYDVVFVEKEEPPAPGEKLKEVGESVFLSKLPTNPKVFALFFPGSSDTDDLQKLLRALGEKAGDNLYVNMGALSDPDYQRAAKRFGLRPLPAIVVTAIGPLAATPEGENAYVRLDGRSLFAKPEELTSTVEELFNLFLAHKISQAVLVGWTQQGKAALVDAGERIWSVIQPVITWLSKKDLALEFATVKIEVKESGGH
jgi:hypothetical protein